MKNRLKILLLPLLLIFAFTNANAKWWIFGQNESSVDVSYLYINSLSFDSVNKDVFLSKDSLDNDRLHIRGKASAGASNIGKVLITIDNKKTWQKAKLTSDGAFDFTFEPELNKKYNIYVQILDTTGKSNDIDETHKVVTVIDKNMREIISNTLKHLKDAYSSEDLTSFMRFVSSDFTGDDTTLELALRKDFSAFDNINIDFTISSIAYDNGKYFVNVSFNRSLESSKDGKVYTDHGVTEFNFVDGKNGAMLYSMKNPLIFGLSDAEEVADGSVVTNQNDDVVVVSTNGDVNKKSIVDIENGTGNDTATGGGTIVLNSIGGDNYESFMFSSESKVTFGMGDINPTYDYDLFANAGNGACMQMIYNETSIDNISSLPDDSGLLCAPDGVPLGFPGSFSVVEVKLANGKYVLFQVQSFSHVPSGSISIKWKYFQ